MGYSRLRWSGGRVAIARPLRRTVSRTTDHKDTSCHPLVTRAAEVAHPVARLGIEIGCGGRDSLRDRDALPSLFASPCAQRDMPRAIP